MCAKANVSVHVCESVDSSPALRSTDSVLLTEQPYRQQDEAAPETRWQQPVQTVAWIVGVSADPVGLLPALLGVDVLSGSQLHSGS